MYRALKAANEIESFRYRIVDDKVFKYDTINASPTINRPNGTFGFSYMNFNSSESIFYKNAKAEIDRVKKGNDLLPAVSGENVIHFSAIPWLDFTSISHARNFKFQDSCPKISFGKIITTSNQIKTMSVSIHVHHGLMDGYHVGLFVEKFQQLLND